MVIRDSTLEISILICGLLSVYLSHVAKRKAMRRDEENEAFIARLIEMNGLKDPRVEQTIKLNRDNAFKSLGNVVYGGQNG